MRKHVLALALVALFAAPAHANPAAMTDGGSPDFAAIERLLDEQGADARRRLMESIGAMDAYLRKAPASPDQLVIVGRAYLRAMGGGASFRAGELATQALKMDPRHGPAHLLVAELAGYAGCASCAEQAVATAREAGADAAMTAAMEGLAYRIKAGDDSKNRAVGEKPPLERAIEAYERAVALESNALRLASHRAALFELERSLGNHARAIAHAEALLASGGAGEAFLAQYAAFLLYERDEVERAAPLAARAASSGAGEGDDTFAMVVYRMWADGYLADPADSGNRVKLETAKGSQPDLGAVFARALSSTATIPVAKALLKAGMVKADDPGMRDPGGNTPLANAVASARADFARGGGPGAYGEPLNDEQLEIVRMLLEQGANPNAYVAGWDQTVLGHAASRGDVRAVRLLLAHRANVHARMGDGATALAEAAESARLEQAVEIADLLLERGVKAASTDRRGETALHAAARMGNARLVERLIEAGADPMARDNSGWRPLEVATSYGHREAAAALLGKGARVGPVANACGTTNALEIARRMERQELIELLREHAKEGI
jgi:ankyrin repeat protein